MSAVTGRDVTQYYTLQDLSGLDAACRVVAGAHDGDYGVWSYQAFDYVNATFFGGALPTPLILWELTPWGGCLGLTRPSTPPLVRLHPGLLGGAGEEPPWGIPRELLGFAYVLGVLLHECIHVRVDSLGGWRGQGPTSHNNARWIAEVNRIAPLLGLDIRAGRSKATRIATEGPPGKNGKPPTKVVRATESTVPFAAVATFPDGVRRHLGLTDYYRQPLPFPHVFERPDGCNAPLGGRRGAGQ
jgi:hypothetical protein